MRILVADDHVLFRRGLELLLLKQYPDAILIGADDAAEALSQISRQEQIDLVLLDLTLPDIHGPSDIRRFVERTRDSKVAVLSPHSKSAVATACIAAGARAFIPKSVNERVLHHAIELIWAGEIYLPASVVVEIGNSRHNATIPANVAKLGPDNPLRQLSSRQQEVLALLVEGNSNKEIGRQLGLLENTVKAHIRTLFRKLGVHNRTQAVLNAASLGWQLPEEQED